MDVREKPEGASCCADRGRTPEPRHAWRHGTSSEPVPSPRLASVLAGFVLASLALCAFPGNAHANICNRTAAVQTAILAKITGVSKCENVTTDHLESITGSMDLRSQSITSLQADDFAGLTSLPHLKLKFDALTELPDGVFDKLSSLERLTVICNSLIELPDGVFDKLTSLTQLTVGINLAMTELPDGVFDKLTSLTLLALSQNHALTELPDGVFDKLTSLTYLNLTSNDLETLPAGLFSGLSNLTGVYLIGNATDPFTLTMEPKQTGANTFEVEVVEGAPFAMTTTLSVLGGTLPGGDTLGTVTVPAGSTTSDPITVTPTGTDPVEVTLGDAPSLASQRFTGLNTAVLPLTLSNAWTVSFESATYTATENGTAATVTVTLDQDSDRALTIPIGVTGGTAATTDYGVSPTSVSFAAGDRTKTLTVTATDDADLADETVVLGFGALPPDVTEGTPATTTVTLVDDDRAGLTVSFEASAYSTIEGAATGVTVRVSLNKAPAEEQTISIEVTGGTAATTDYSVSPTSVSFAAGDRTKTLTVTATDDALAEVNETVVLGFGSLPPDVTEGTPATTTVTLVDDDQAGLTVSFEASAYSTIEGAATGVTVRVSLNKAPAEEQTISIEVTGGTAATTDYSVSPTSVSFAAGDRTKTLTVTATDDALAEVNETVVLGFGTLPPDVTEGTLATTTVTLVDDDRAALRVSFGADAYTATENGTAATVTVTLDQDSDRDLTISIGVTGGTAATTDYGVSPTSVSFAAGDRTKTLTVTATDDADLADETVVLGFGSLPPDVTEGTPATTTVTLVDDDQAGLTVSFEASAYSTIEGAATGVTVRVSLNKAPAEEQTISIEVTGGTAATTDYSVSPTSVSFAAGDRTKTLTVTATDDALAEVNETVVLGFGTLPPDVTEGTLATTTVTLVDDDRAALRVSFGADAYTATENGTAATVTVTLDQDSDRDADDFDRGDGRHGSNDGLRRLAHQREFRRGRSDQDPHGDGDRRCGSGRRDGGAGLRVLAARRHGGHASYHHGDPGG